MWVMLRTGEGTKLAETDIMFITFPGPGLTSLAGAVYHRPAVSPAPGHGGSGVPRGGAGQLQVLPLPQDDWPRPAHPRVGDAGRQHQPLLLNGVDHFLTIIDSTNSITNLLGTLFEPVPSDQIGDFWTRELELGIDS